MNIFVTDSDPKKSAIVLPDRHIVKMPIESAQMLAIAADYYGLGTLPKKDGTPYDVSSKSRKNHPCTQWVLKHIVHVNWLISHARELCEEYTLRYNKVHSTIEAIEVAHIKFSSIFAPHFSYEQLNFVRSMPDDLKNDTSISTFLAYKKYINQKPWVSTNYIRLPDRKPNWIA